MDTALNQIATINYKSEAIGSAYRTLYERTFEMRQKAYTEALDQIKGRQEWVAISENPDIPEEQRDLIIKPLQQRVEAILDLPLGATVSRRTGATLTELESDILAVESISRDILRRILDLAAPEEEIERVAVAKLFPGRITSTDDLESFLGNLRERLNKVLAQGGTIILE